jgi:hypothetical protein
MVCQSSFTPLKRGTYRLRFKSVMVHGDNADKTNGSITVRTCLSNDCAANTVVDDYKYVNTEIDYGVLSYTDEKDPMVNI